MQVQQSLNQREQEDTQFPPWSNHPSNVKPQQIFWLVEIKHSPAQMYIDKSP